MNTIIIYDWDDTLFPTSYIHDKMPVNTTDMELLEDKNIKLIELSRQLGQTIIITNASTLWIYNSAEEYMPNLYKYIKYNNIPIISAREYATGLHITDYLQWKDITFYNTIKRLSTQSHINNILSVGDAVYERNALMKYGRFINTRTDHTTYIKTIKYIDRPTPLNMIHQTTSLLFNISYHIQFRFDLHVDM